MYEKEMGFGLRKDHSNSPVSSLQMEAAEPLTVAAQFSQQSRPFDLLYDVSREKFSKLLILPWNPAQNYTNTGWHTPVCT